jgi:zinc transport system ATP-binding protein
VSEQPAIAIEGLTFTYDGVTVLEDVDLTVRHGAMDCMVGPNGGGKTTLLRLMLGLLRPNEGQVRVLGRPPAEVRRRIGYMPQHAHHDPQFPVTVMDVVLMGRLERHWGGPYRRDDKRAALDALDEVGMADLSGRLFNALSGGQRQRVLIARALTCEPELLLLDEPTANVDVAVESRLYEILQELNKRMTILVATHDLGFVADIVERVICVNRRVVVHPTSEITGEVLQDIYGGDVRAVHHDRRFADGGRADD